jgi:hypothetical protein
MTLTVDEHVHLIATLTKNTLILGKLTKGDMIAMESK